MRLDVAVAEKFRITRNKAHASIGAGFVSVNGKTAAKPSQDVAPEDVLELRENPSTQYVSRAALKLKGLLEGEGIALTGLDVLDVGASTGGFTQVALEYGAAKVWAVDVGSGQLDARVASDPRVTNMEKTDVREARIGSPAGCAVADVSFIGLDKVLPDVLRLCAPGALLLLLYKPQFQVGPKQVGKGGVVRDQSAIKAGLGRFRETLESLGCSVLKEVPSVLPGESGNREFFFVARAPEPSER